MHFDCLVMSVTIAVWITNNVEPGQTSLWSLIYVYTVFSDMSIWICRINTIVIFIIPLVNYGCEVVGYTVFTLSIHDRFCFFASHAC